MMKVIFPWEIAITDGGQQDDPRRWLPGPNIFDCGVGYELVTPKILTCPKDKDTTVTGDWPNLAGYGQHQLLRGAGGGGIKILKVCLRATTTLPVVR
jgi:hypothetical protein